MSDKTKRRIAKFILFIFLASTIFSSITLLTVRGASPDIVVTNVSIVSGSSPVSENDTFNLAISYKNQSGVAMSGMVLDFSAATNVVLTSGSSTQVQTNPNDQTVAIGATATTQVTLKYISKSGDGKIPITFLYTKLPATSGSTESFIFIDAAPTDTSTGTPTDTTKYKPVLDVTVLGSNTVQGGKNTEISLVIKNTSATYAAKNVTITSALEANSPFIGISFTTGVPIVEIKANSSVTLTMTVATDKFAATGTFKLPLNIDYQNPWSDGFTKAATLSLQVENFNTPGRLNIEGMTTNPATVVAGQEFTLNFTLKNNGSLAVKDVRASLEGLTAQGFMLVSGTNRFTYDYIQGNGSKQISVTLKASSEMKSGSTPLKVNITFNDLKNEEVKDTEELWIPVNGTGDTNAFITIRDLKTSASTLDPGNTVRVTVTISNDGGTTAKQIKVSADGGSQMFPTTQNLFIVNQLAKGETKTLTFNYQVQADAARGSAPVTIKVESGGTEAMSQAVSVFINGSTTAPDASKNIPKVIVSSYSYAPDVVKAGERFVLSLAFTNTHSSKTIRNIRASFNVESTAEGKGNVFTPVDSSNTFFIDKIAPKGVVDQSVNLYTIPDAAAKTYTVTISFDYEDENGNPFKTDEIIGIPVYQPSRFEISEPQLPTETMLGQPVYASFEMYNLGKTVLYNVKMRVEGDIEAQPKSQYFGNFDPGRNEYLELNLTPMMPGTATGNLIVSYETATGEVIETNKEFTMNVMEMPIDGGLGPDGKPIDPGVIFDENGNQILPDGTIIGPDGNVIEQKGEGGFFASIWFKIIIGVVVLIVVVIIITRIRKRKQEKGLEF